MPDAAELLDRLTGRLAPLEHAHNLAWWQAAVDAGPATEAAKVAAEDAWIRALSDQAAYQEVRGVTGAGEGDPGTIRALRHLERLLFAGQVPDDLRPELVALQAKVQSAFATVRGTVDGRQVGNIEIDEVLQQSDLAGERMAHWEAGKQVGQAVAADLVRLAELRNELARRLGHRDYRSFSLAAGELEERWLDGVLAQVEQATTAPFAAYKSALDERLAARFGVAARDLEPWHYPDPFFQRPEPAQGGLRPLLEGRDQVALATVTYDGMGLETREVVARSDLRPRAGKNQHAFCISIDRGRDIRVLANLGPGEDSFETLLHELGHAVYDDNIGAGLPWALREPPHAFLTEGVALLLGRLVRDPELLTVVLGVGAQEAEHLAAGSRRDLAVQLLVFARWCLVMVRFEQAFYADPHRDLEGTWWQLVDRFQGLRRPAGRDTPDWAAKIHLTSSPVYYQNYLLGELVASQVGAAVRRHAAGFVGRSAAGSFLAGRVFAPGAGLPWPDLVAGVTGRPLGVEAFSADLLA